jgi:hypothetical protein
MGNSWGSRCFNADCEITEDTFIHSYNERDDAVMGKRPSKSKAQARDNPMNSYCGAGKKRSSNAPSQETIRPITTDAFHRQFCDKWMEKELKESLGLSNAEDQRQEDNSLNGEIAITG